MIAAGYADCFVLGFAVCMVFGMGLGKMLSWYLDILDFARAAALGD